MPPPFCPTGVGSFVKKCPVDARRAFGQQVAEHGEQGYQRNDGRRDRHAHHEIALELAVEIELALRLETTHHLARSKRRCVAL